MVDKIYCSPVCRMGVGGYSVWRWGSGSEAETLMYEDDRSNGSGAILEAEKGSLLLELRPSHSPVVRIPCRKEVSAARTGLFFIRATGLVTVHTVLTN